MRPRRARGVLASRALLVVPAGVLAARAPRAMAREIQSNSPSKHAGELTDESITKGRKEDGEIARFGCPRRVRERLRGRGVAAYAVEQQAVETVGELVGVALRRQPRIGPVQGREDEQRGRRVVEVGSELAELSPLAEERAEPLVVAAALRQD